MVYKQQSRRKSSMRLQEWDYASPGYYFITICTHQREYLFENEKFRATAEALWQNIPIRPQGRHHTCLDESVFMPDHSHGILELFDYPPGWKEKRQGSKDLQSGSISAIVGTFKSIAAKYINLMRGTPGEKVWQRGYYDRIIRDEKELIKVREYIRNNPDRWNENRDNLDMLLTKMRWVWWVD